MPAKLVVPGATIPALPEAVDHDARALFGVTITPKVAVAIKTETRGEATEVTIPVGADDQDCVAELEFADGTREWISVRDLRERLPQTSRSDEDVIRVAETVATDNTRSLPGRLLKGFKLLDIQFPDDLADEIAAPAARALMAYYEKCLKPGPGLYTVDRYGRLTQYPPDSLLAPSENPYLVLIHGTFLTTGSSFGRLLASTDWPDLCDVYGPRIVGFNHRTLTESPAQNALELVRQLPHRARLHLLTHSRGGLVGELLAHGPLPQDALDLLEKAGRPKKETKALRDLSELLHKKQVRVERFVRVACPVRGTILDSERLDRYMSLLLNLIGLLPAVDDALVYPFAKAVILSLIKQRARPEQIPGLEAMAPQSPFIRLVNHPSISCAADLAVIAGDVEGGGLLSSLGVLATDLFYAENHDLVVNTDAMFKSTDREPGICYSYEKGPHITHFNYFSNDSSRRRIKAWLVRKDGDDTIPPGFRKLETEPVPEIVRGERGRKNREEPVVFLIPTLMGSHLRTGDHRIWLDLDSLSKGEFAELEWRGVDDTSAIDELVSWQYGDLQKALSEQFDVVPFPYDWRKPALAEGERLAVELQAELRKHKRPIHVLAHGTGGLVALRMIDCNRAAWQQMVERGGRLVLLGTPPHGADEIAQLLLGRARLARLLALLDPQQKGDMQAVPDPAATGTARVFRSFPGIVELLPEEQDDFWDAGWWERQGVTGTDAQAFYRLLAVARDSNRTHSISKIPQLPWATEGHICYVATTPAASAAGEGDRSLGLALDATEGPPGVPTWYMNASPGMMVKERSGFGALADLLERGATNQLTGEKPPPGPRVAQSPASAPALFPTTRDLVAAAFGSRPPRRHQGVAAVLKVSVAHGSLEGSSHPLAVGHYYGDAIVNAERFLDRQLGGKLSRRFSMHLYPGEGGTAEVLLAPDQRPPGALVIGLGEVGSLSAEVLAQGVMTAALRHAVARLECGAPLATNRNYVSAGFSSLVIGTNGGHALTVESSVAAIIKGAVLANRVLRDLKLWQDVRIDELQFVELYEDIGARVARTVQAVREDPFSIGLEPGEAIETADCLETIPGGLLRSPASPFDSDWWRRVQISETGLRRRVGSSGDLEFISLTDRARAEQTLHGTQRDLIDRLVAEAIRRQDFRADLHATLYELLLPNTLKDQMQQTANLLLILDGPAANYPWEMLCERGQEPLAIRFGLLRQLKTVSFRPAVRRSRENIALVIGDPAVGDPAVPRLPHAREEAELVASQLRKCGYEVVEKIGSTALEITSALCGNEYRIIHITGHGHYDPKRPDRSGVVLAKDLFLSALEIGQMRVTPEMVCLNCCHLGKMDVPWNLLAASVAQELIKIGVGAVVAAGWAIEDKASKDFGVEFYRHMLAENGQFGEATLHARRFVRLHHPDVNTWGAFQCYGLPTFELGGRPARTASKKQQPVTRSEIIEQLGRIRGEASSASPQRLVVLAAQVPSLDRALRDPWRTGSVLYELGETYAALGELALAIDCYRQALGRAEEDSRVPIRAAEQLAKVEILRAAQLRRDAGQRSGTGADEPFTQGDPKTLLEDARGRLELALAFGATAERRGLLASCLYLLILECEGSERVRAVEEAAMQYEKPGLAASRGAGQQATTLDSIALRLAISDGDAPEKAGLLQEIGACEKTAPDPAPEQDFWSRANRARALLLRATVSGDVDQKRVEILRAYQEVLDVRPPAFERESIVIQLDFLREILVWRGSHDLAQQIGKLRGDLPL